MTSGARSARDHCRCPGGAPRAGRRDPWSSPSLVRRRRPAVARPADRGLPVRRAGSGSGRTVAGELHRAPTRPNRGPRAAPGTTGPRSAGLGAALGPPPDRRLRVDPVPARRTLVVVHGHDADPADEPATADHEQDQDQPTISNRCLPIAQGRSSDECAPARSRPGCGGPEALQGIRRAALPPIRLGRAGAGIEPACPCASPDDATGARTRPFPAALTRRPGSCAGRAGPDKATLAGDARMTGPGPDCPAVVV